MKKISLKKIGIVAALVAASVGIGYYIFNEKKSQPISYADIVSTMQSATASPTDTLQVENQNIVQNGMIQPTENAQVEILGDLESQVRDIRIRRASQDPDYLKRVNPDLFDKYSANFLFIGKSNTISPPDVYKILSLGDSGKIDITSIHRDLYVPELDRRVNFAWYKGFSTPDVLIPIVENITGIPIDYWFFANTQFVVADIIDTLTDKQPITVIVTYECGSAYPGEKKLMMGKQAVEYARLRKCDSDDTRMKRQDEVIQAIETKITDDFKKNPKEVIDRIDSVYKVLEKYNKYDQISMGTSDGRELSVDGIKSVGEATLFNLVGGFKLPEMNKEVVLGLDIELYLPWTGERMWYQSITQDTFRIWERGEIDHNLQWNTIYSNGITPDTMQFLRNDYYLRVRQELAKLLLEN